MAAAGERVEPRAVSRDPVAGLLARLKRESGARIAGELVIPERAGVHVDLPERLDPRLASALRRRGVERLYSHQARAWEHLARGRHTVIATPTATGKSLCYNGPVLEDALARGAKALYLFPTKALSQDQVAELLELSRAGDLGVRAHTFDGDTPSDARKAVRTRAEVVVTNPDMLHQGILPHHTKWARFFERLRFVVIDELHIYRGVFGSHMANVLRRLKRICRFYGADPVFALASATIANPAELAARLIEAEVEAVTESGAPRGRRHLLLWNPPLVNAELGIRASARSQAAHIARLALRAGLRTIVFSLSRLMTEVLTKYLKETFDRDPRRPARVRGYRGGYLPGERRAVERALRAGEIECVVATSALELGVDVGSLDVAVLAGYPGTVAGTWQRLGRAGRRERPSLGVLVASSAPLDQYLVRNPEFFLGASPEHARIDPDQLLILMDHIRCAAFELPFRDGERFGSEPLEACLAYLEEQQVLHHEGERWHWMADDYPAQSVSLRSVAEGNFVVIDVGGGRAKVIAEVDYASASLTLYEGAIYLLQGKPWQVERLDWTGRKAYVRETRADYYTDAVDYTRLKVLEEFARAGGAAGARAHGEVHVVRRVAGYKKIRFRTHENVGYGQVRLPDQELHTSAAWWRVDPARLFERLATHEAALAGFLGAAHAVHFSAALHTMSEPGDLGRSVGSGEDGGDGAPGGGVRQGTGGFEPTLYLYDNYPGGIGLAPAIFELGPRIVAHARSLVAACPCRHGCPACVGPVLEAATPSGGEQGSAKASALTALSLLVEQC